MFYIRVEAPDILWESIQEKYLGLKKQVTPDSGRQGPPDNTGSLLEPANPIDL